MTTLIGAGQTERHACDKIHLPNCYNPGLDLTACVCGQVWWRGQVGTWHSRQLRKEVGRTMAGNPIHETTGWDRYFLHTTDCTSNRVNPASGHLCREAEALTAAQAFNRETVAVA